MVFIDSEGSGVPQTMFFIVSEGSIKTMVLSILKGPLQMHWAHSAMHFGGVTRFTLILKPFRDHVATPRAKRFRDPHLKLRILLITGEGGGSGGGRSWQ
jgi:hypothetical protein